LTLRSTGRLGLFLLLVLIAARARAAFEVLERQLPLATEAMSAGAFGPVREGVQGVLFNPAALPLGEEAELALSGGDGGREADWTGATALLWPFQDDLSAGLAYDHLAGAGGPGFAEQSLGLAAGLQPLEGLGIGLRPWLHRSSSDAGVSILGFSMDAGALWRQRFNRDHSASIGWWGSQLASEWPDRYWHKAVPVTQHLGLGWQWRRMGELAVSLEQASLAGRDLPPLLRAGLLVTHFKRLRPAVGFANESTALFSAGFSAPFRSWGVDWELSYAALIAADGSELRHRFEISASFQARQHSDVVAVPLKVTYEPGTKKVKSATVSLAVAQTAASTTQDWELEIRDKSGKVVRVLTGSGVPPALVTWDGKDALGEALADGEEVSYKLNLKTASGLRSSKPGYAIEGGLSNGGLEALAVADTNALVVPVTNEDGKVTQLQLKAPAMPGETQHWQIVIQDQAGNTLKTLEGEGPIPSPMNWDGLDKDGKNVLSQPGLRVRFNAWDKAGQINSVDQALDAGLQPVQEQEEPLPRLGLKLPAFSEGGAPATLMLSDKTLAPLSEEAPPPTPVPTPRPTRIPTPRPTRTPTQRPTASPTPPPTAVPTPVPTAVPTAVPTPIPTALPTALPTAVPTPEATEAPPPPTSVPTPIPTAVKAAAGIGAGLSRANYLASPDLLPPVFMTREQAEGKRASQPSRGGGHSHLPAAINGVLDVFMPGSAVVDPAKADKLQAFFWRLNAFKQRRILLTGLVGKEEGGGEELSRARVREISRLMVEEGGFQGEFILKVDGKPGELKGVRVEVLRR
jgi:flagellar hook assembly protein FlgD